MPKVTKKRRITSTRSKRSSSIQKKRKKSEKIYQTPLGPFTESEFKKLPAEKKRQITLLMEYYGSEA